MIAMTEMMEEGKANVKSIDLLVQHAQGKPNSIDLIDFTGRPSHRLDDQKRQTVTRYVSSKLRPASA